MMRKEKMIGNRRERKSIRKDKRAFTGLEAAIVLTAFIVVAAVFSYVVLNAGFFTTQKAKSTVHSGVRQATSSFELCGDVVGYADSGDTNLDYIIFYVRNTAGKTSVDINATTIAITDSSTHAILALNTSGADSAGYWTYTFIDGDGDSLLEKNEKVQIKANFVDLGKNADFTVEAKPVEGASLVFSKSVPGAIYDVMNLY
jgi:flagellin FlaB